MMAPMTTTERLAAAGAYVVDLIVRTLAYATVTALIVAPDRLAADADVAAHAVGGESAASLLSRLPVGFYYVPLGVLTVPGWEIEPRP